MSKQKGIVPAHGLHLATDETVKDAWEAFFSACWDAWELVEKRRAAKLKSVQNAAVPSGAELEVAS